MRKMQLQMLIEYLIRLESELYIQLDERRKNLSLKTVDAVDIIDFVETRAQYEVAVKVVGDISKILSSYG